MKARQAVLLSIQNIKRGKRSFFLSVFGITVAISIMSFFLALTLGIKKRLLDRVFPPGRLEVTGPTAMLDLFGPKPLNDEVVKELQKHPDIQAVYPRMKAVFPMSGWGGEKLLGRVMYTDLIVDGIDPDAVPELTMQGKHPAEVYQKNHLLPFRDLSLKEEPYCEKDEDCQSPMYCAWDRNRCEMPIPVIISPTLLEIYNGSLASIYNLPKLSGLTKEVLLPQLFGMGITVRLNQSFFKKTNETSMHPRRFMLVGLNDRAIGLGLTVPLPYIQRWNEQFVGGDAGKNYTSLSIEVKKHGSVTAVIDAVKKLGYEIQDNGAEKVGLAVMLITTMFLLISFAIIFVAIVNITHTFFRIVSERRKELGIMRAVGASALDLKIVILGEAMAIGTLGATLGLLTSWLISLGINFLSARVLPDFPFKPDSYFYFSPWLLLGALTLSMLSCVLGAYFPARSAARLSPSEVLSGV